MPAFAGGVSPSVSSTVDPSPLAGPGWRTFGHPSDAFLTPAYAAPLTCAALEDMAFAPPTPQAYPRSYRGPCAGAAGRGTSQRRSSQVGGRPAMHRKGRGLRGG